MPTIGIAGVTIPGAVDCIQKINQFSSSYFPPAVHPHIVLVQPNFAPMKKALLNEEWDVILSELFQTIEKLAYMGADFAIIPANSVHKVISDLQKKSPIPVINLLEVAAEECRRLNLKKVGILGTTWTMSGHLYGEVLRKNRIEEWIPSETDQKIIQDAILSELVPNGKTKRSTFKALLQMIETSKLQGCDGIALACTELPLALNAENCRITVIDTTLVLAKAALEKSAAHPLTI